MTTKKDQIFQAIISHINKAGLLKNLTIAEIARLADVGKGTVYEYFSSKDEVICETIIYILESIMAETLFEIPTNTQFSTILIKHIEAMLKVSQKYANIDLMLMTDGISSTLEAAYKQKLLQKVIEIKKKYTDYLKTLISIGVKESIIKDIPDQYLIFIVGNIIMTGVSYYYHELPQEARNEKEHINRIYQTIIKLLS